MALVAYEGADAVYTYDDGTGNGGGGSTWWNDNSGAVLGFGTNLVNGLLSFGSSIYAINHGQTPTYPKPSGTGGAQPQQQQQQQQPPATNWLLWVIVVLVILAVMFGIFLIVRNNQGGKA